jgi:chemotaxis protein methyltransferase CheR
MLEQRDSCLVNGSEVAACIIYFLAVQDFNSADTALCYLEKFNSCAYASFLRGECLFLQETYAEAEKYFQEAAVKNKIFWPAFYRIASLSAEGNRTRYEYKINKAIASIELGKDKNYECFMGGFSPDYFRRILEKKLS